MIDISNILGAKLDYSIDYMPMPTPRPRARVMMMKNGSALFAAKANKSLKNALSYLYVSVYSPTEYDKYKTFLAILIRKLKPKIEPDNYSGVVVNFYLPYPKSTPKKNLFEGYPHFKKPDLDNLQKGFIDALVDAKVLISDGYVSLIVAQKRYTTEPNGRIEFSLIK